MYADLQQEFNVHFGVYEGKLSSAYLSLLASDDGEENPDDLIAFKEYRPDEIWKIGCDNLSQKCEVLDSNSSVVNVLGVDREAEFSRSEEETALCDAKKELDIGCESLSSNGEVRDDFEVSMPIKQEIKSTESNSEAEFGCKVEIGADGKKEMENLSTSDEFLDDSAITIISDHKKEMMESSGSTAMADCDGDVESSSSVYLSLASDSSESSTEFPLKNKSSQNEMQVLCDNLSGISDHSGRSCEENLSWYWTNRRREHSRNLSMKSETESNLTDDLQRDGSLRKEKEWKRTLACKLFEERMQFKLCEEREVVEGCQEMDMLWEAYEENALKLDKKVKKNKSEVKRTDEEEEEEEFDEKATGEVCCLQALRLSTGKMNLGVGRPNLMKISKALKGMGLLQRFSSRRSMKR